MSSSQPDVTDIPPDFVVDSSRLPLTDVDGEQVLRMFWLDAYEDPYKQPGRVTNRGGAPATAGD